jgi:hypothetical protein
MGIYSDIQTDLSEAFGTDLSDAVSPMIFRQVTSTLFDNVTNKPTINYLDIQCRGVVDGVSMREVSVSGGALRSTDSSVFILHSELPVTVTLDDNLIIFNIEYKIIQINLESTGSIHDIIVRKNP